MDFDQPIKEAYFPKMDSLVASRSWPARVANQKLTNLRREVDQITLDVDELKRWRDRIFDAINSGTVRLVSQYFQNIFEIYKDAKMYKFYFRRKMDKPCNSQNLKESTF